MKFSHNLSDTFYNISLTIIFENNFYEYDVTNIF